jgi:hypothetical protein
MLRRGASAAALLAALLLAPLAAMSIAAQEEEPTPAKARYGGGAPAAEAAPRRPLPTPPASFADAQALADYFDLVLADGWKAEGIVPGAPVDDATWLRRLSLDLRGEIASDEEVRRFLGDDATDRRERWIEAFLGDRRFATQMANRWTKLLLVGAGMNSVRMVRYVRPWLEEQFAAGRSLADIARQMLTDTCDGVEVDGCGLMLAYFDSVESLTAIVARSFLGLQIQCAQCHDHPFDRWKQDDFNRFAAFFADSRADFAPLRDREARMEAEEKAQARNSARREAMRASRGKRGSAMGAMGGGMMGGGAMGIGAAGDDPARYDELFDSPIQCGFIVEDSSPEMVLAKGLRKLDLRSNAGGVGREEMLKRGEDGAGKGEMADSASDAADAVGAAMKAAARPDADGPRVDRSDSDTIRELTRLLQSAARHPGETAVRLGRDQVKFDRLVAQLAPDAVELVEKYRTRRESFSKPGFPDGGDYVPPKGTRETKREALADWIVGAGNPWFGPSVANRVVAQFFGKGLVEPVDDLSGSIDRVLPELLDVLGRAFLEHGSDIRFLCSALARTRAYALGASPEGDAHRATVAERWLAAHPARPLTLEQFCRSLLKSTDPAFAAAESAEDIAREEWRARQLARSMAGLCTAPDGTGTIWWSATIPQALFAMNGEASAIVPADPAAPGFGDFADLGRDPVLRLSPLWLRIVGRPPAADEAERALSLLPSDAAMLPRAYGELRWALLNSTEFQVNH